MSSSKGKKERRKERHLKNIKKEIEYKKQAWDAGKLIEENHNQEEYSMDYTVKLSERLLYILKNKVLSQDNSTTIKNFRLYKNKIRDLILHWNPRIEKNNIYFYLKGSLEVYWDDTDNLSNFLLKEL